MATIAKGNTQRQSVVSLVFDGPRESPADKSIKSLAKKLGVNAPAKKKPAKKRAAKK